MSGGSFNYLCCKDVPDVFNYVRDLEEMEQFLISDGHIDIAKDVRRLIEYVRSAEIRIGVLLESLNKVFHDIEWYVSADIGKERLLKTLEDYRNGKTEVKNDDR